MLRTKIGDPQARAELLASLFRRSGIHPRLLQYGSGRNTSYAVVLELTDEQITELESLTGVKAYRIQYKGVRYIPFCVKSGVKAGQLRSSMYDPATNTWHDVISVH